MTCRFIVLSFVFTLLGCGEVSEQDFLNPQLPKTNIAQEACDSLNLMRDIGLTGYFLDRFVRCASRKVDGQDSLVETIDAFEKVGMSDIGQFEFLLQDGPGGTASYPYLTMLAVLLERGAWSSDGSLVSGNDRFGSLNIFLEKINQ